MAIIYKRGRRITLLFALLLYLLSTKYIGNALLSPFEEDYYHAQTLKNADAVVILSGGHNGETPNLPLGDGSFKRAIYGIMLAKKENLPIIYSGAGRKTYSESDAMKDTVNQLNEYFNIGLEQSPKLMPQSFSISYETKSVDTYENAAFTKELFLKNGIKNPKIYLVTSAFHMRRSAKLYRHFGFEVTPAATDFRTTKKYSLNAYFPSMTGLQMSYFALHEHAGIALLALKLK